jgi:hypothetical protein
MWNNQDRYRGVIKYQDHQNKSQILDLFETPKYEHAIARLARLLAEEYPNAKGELIDLLTGKVIHRCQKTAIC